MKFFNFNFKHLFVLSAVLLLGSVQVWGTGTAITSLNFSNPSSAPSAYTYSSTNPPTQESNDNMSSEEADNRKAITLGNGGSTAPTTFSATDAVAPSGGKRWIAFQPAEDCTVTITVGIINKDRIFYLLDKDHSSTSDCVSSYGPSTRYVWDTGWTVNLTGGTWYVIIGSGSNCLIHAMSFVSSSCTTNATVTAGSNSSVTATTATVTCSSGISSLGSAGCSISSYGFVIGTSANPAVGGSGVTKHEVGTSYTTTGTSFYKDLTGLTPGTTYYVRPYATNGKGTAYGTQTSFTTKYKVTYDGSSADGGSVPTDATSYASGSTVTVLGNTGSLTRTIDDCEATFLGWSTNSNMYGGTHYSAGDEFEITGNTTLYAIWGFSISYYEDDGETAVDGMEPTSYIHGQGATLPTASKTGYTGTWYNEWCVETKNKGTFADECIRTSISSSDVCNASYLVKWAAETYTITLNGNGGTGNTANVTATYNSSTLSSAITNPTQTGYVFEGWYSGEGGTGTLIIDNAGALQASTTYTDGSGNWTNDGDVTLYAKWTEEFSSARTYDGEEKMYFLRDAWNWWAGDAAVFYAYFWNSSTSESAWSGKAVYTRRTTDNTKDIWEYTVPEGTWDKVIITRHPSGTTTPTFDNASNKSNDITLEATTNFLTDWTVSGETGHAITWKNITLASKKVYFDNRNYSTWTTAYVRIGHSTSNSVWGAMTKVGGTKYLYEQSTSAWDYHTYLSVANAEGWAGSHNVYQPWENQNWESGDIGYKITKQTTYQNFGVARDVYLCPTSTSMLERECQYYNVNGGTSTNTFDYVNAGTVLPAYEVTSSGTHCTVTMVKYTADDFSTSESLSSGGTVKPTQYIGVTVTPDAGYKFSSVSLSTGKFEQHTAAAAGVTGKYAIMADECEVTAVCVEDTYTITYKDGGDVAFSGVLGDGSPEEHTYGTPTPLVDPTRDGYSFGGWYTNSNFTGSKVTTLTADGYTANITLYAQWTKNVYLEMGDGWDSDSPWFAVYYYESGSSGVEGWAEMELADACSDPAVYTAQLPMAVYDYLIFVRMDPSKDALSWDNKWTQTENVTYPTTNFKYTITDIDGGADGKSTGSWGSYSIPTYTISYNAGTNGSGSKASEAKTCNVDFTLPSSAVFTRSGYTQTGWTTSDGDSQTHELGGSYTTDAAQTFYPVWTPKSYSITYLDQGGSAFSGSHADGYPTTHTYASATTLKTASKTGYTFDGWYKLSACTGDPVTSLGATEYTADITLYAKWTAATYSIDYTTNGGAINSGNVTSYTYGVGATLPTDVTRSGYLFAGWYDNSGLTGDAVTAVSTTQTGNQAYYAKWVELYTVTKGSLSNGDITISPTTAVSDATISIAASANIGYSFTSWTITKTTGGDDVTSTLLGDNITTSSTSFTMPAYDVTVDASFVVQTYALSYSIGTGATGAASGGTAAGSYAEGTTITVPAQGTLANTGYTFRGWTDGTTFYTAGQSFSMPTSDVTLSAVWVGTGGSCTTLAQGTQNAEHTAMTATVGTITTTGGEAQDGYIKLSGSSSQCFVVTAKAGYTISAGDKLTMRVYNKASSADNIGFQINSTSHTASIASKSEGQVIYTLLSTDISDGTVTIKRNDSKDRYHSILLERCVVSNFTVSFADGNTAPASHLTWPDDIEGVPTGKKILQPANPTATGYIFGGWYTNANCTTAVDFSTMTISADKTLYAKWTEKSTPAGTTLTPTASSVCSGSSTTLTLNASTSGVEYELYEGETKLRTVTGTGSALSLGSTSNLTAAKTYIVKTVENDDYKGMTLDVEATVSIKTASSVSVASTSLAATVDESFTIDGITGSGSGDLSYQWYSYTSSDGAGESLIAGAESDSYTFTPDEAGSYYFKCEVTGECGSLKSDMITVTASVAKIDPTVYELSGTTSVCEGDEATITLSGSDDGVTYALYLDGVDQSDDKVGDGNAITWTVTADGTYTVSAKADATYNAADMDGSAVISYKTATAIGTQPTTEVSGHDGVDFTLGSDLAATGEGTLTYQWYSYTSAEGAGQATVGSATTTKTLTTSKAAGTYYYKVEVIGECGRVKSDMITVTIDNKHLLTYDANGGEGAPSAIWKSSGSMTLSSTEPTRDGYRFLGWNTEDDGTGDHYDAGGTYKMGSTAATLYAEWGETATLTWTLTTGTGESSVSTSEKNSTNGTRIAKSNMSNLLNNGLAITNNSKNDYTVKIEAPSSKDNDKYMYVTFVIADNYELVPSAVTATFQPVDGTASADMILSDTHGHSISLTGASCSKGSANEKTITNSEGVCFSGTVTLKIYCYGSSANTYRLGSTITITGDVNYVCPERATITSPTAPQDIKLYTDRTKTLTVEATPYSSGTLHYQWKKDGVNIVGATSASHTVYGSIDGTVGESYVYTCEVTQTSPDACVTVTSPAFTIKIASPDCGQNIIAEAVLNSTSTASTLTGGTLLQNGLNGSGPYKLNGKPSWFGIKMNSNFQVGDSIIFKLKVGDWWSGASATSVPVVVFAGQNLSKEVYRTAALTAGTDNTYVRFAVTQEMIDDHSLTDTIMIWRSKTNDPSCTECCTQNHQMYSVQVKRYGCPDIFIYDDAAATHEWSDDDNWIGPAGHGSGLPTSDDRVLINESITVDTEDAAAAEVHLASEKTMTVEKPVTLGDVIVETGSTLNVAKDGDDGIELALNSLSLKGGWNSDKTNYDMPRVYINPDSKITREVSTINFDISVDNRNYYPIALPFDVPLNSVDYAESYIAEVSEYGTHYEIDEYDGEKRAEYGGGNNNWKRMEAGSTLKAGTGYILSGLTVGGKAIIRFPMDVDDAWLAGGEKGTATVSAVSTTKNEILVTAYVKEKGTTPVANKGWNLIGVPFMSCYTTSAGMYDAENVDKPATLIAGRFDYKTGKWTEEDANFYVTVPTHDFTEFKQSPISEAVLMPGWCFFVQVEETGSLIFLGAQQATSNSSIYEAPRREQSMPTIKTGIILSGNEASDKTTFLISDKYSAAEYEINADLEKMYGENGYTLATYSLSGDTRLAYNAMSRADAANVIPIGYRAPAEGEYTFAINPRYVENGDFERIDLIDYETGFVTNLLQSSYTFTSDRTQSDNRFALNVVPQKETPTDVEPVTGDGLPVTGARKVIIDNKLYIILNNRMYDAKGVMVK